MNPTPDAARSRGARPLEVTVGGHEVAITNPEKVLFPESDARVAAAVHEPGTALVPGRLLAEIIRSLPASGAEFRSEADEVALTCGSAEFGLVSLPLSWAIPDLKFEANLAYLIGLALIATSLLFFTFRSWREERRALVGQPPRTQ